MYQIFTDRFYNGDPTNDVQDREYVYIGERHIAGARLESDAGSHDGSA